MMSSWRKPLAFTQILRPRPWWSWRVYLFIASRFLSDRSHFLIDYNLSVMGEHDVSYLHRNITYAPTWSRNPQSSDIIYLICHQVQANNAYVRLSAELQSNSRIPTQSCLAGEYFVLMWIFNNDHHANRTSSCCNLCRLSCRNSKSSCFPF